LVYEKLCCKTEVGGIAPYENDYYHHVSNKVPGNPWFVTTLCLAQLYIENTNSNAQLKHASDIIDWVASHALPGAVLPEQVIPFTYQPLSVSPLTWSLAEFIIAVNKLIRKYCCLNAAS